MKGGKNLRLREDLFYAMRGKSSQIEPGKMEMVYGIIILCMNILYFFSYWQSLCHMLPSDLFDPLVGPLKLVVSN